MKRTKKELTISNWFNQLTSELRKEGKTRTSCTSFYMRILRAAYNKACEQGPIIRQRSGNLYRKYQSRLAVINRYLKVISLRTGLPIPLSMYVARHSWATCAQHADVPIEVISKALGHESERTTRIYLATIEASKIDEANKRLLALI